MSGFSESSANKESKITSDINSTISHSNSRKVLKFSDESSKETSDEINSKESQYSFDSLNSYKDYISRLKNLKSIRRCFASSSNRFIETLFCKQL